MEPVDPPVVFGVREHRLDHLDPPAIEQLAVLRGQDCSHPGVAPAGPPGSGCAAAATVGWGQHLDVLVGDDLVEVLLVLVAGMRIAGGVGCSPADARKNVMTS